MRKQQIYQLQLVVCILAAVCSCNKLADTTSEVQELKRQMSEMREMFMSYKAEVGELAGEVRSDDKLVGQSAGPPGPPGPPGPRGRRGRRGKMGDIGAEGPEGSQGDEGPMGPQGDQGLIGPRGDVGPAGADGAEGAMGPQGDEGPPGPQAGGATYTRWGRTACGSDSTLIYDGFMAKQYYEDTGGGINYQCLVNDTEYNSNATVGSNYARLSGTEYQTNDYGIFPDEAHDENAPCAVCYAENRTSTLMIPGKRTCPINWNKEYEGYLMSARDAHNSPSTYECIDENPEYVAGEGGNDNGGLLYFNRADCGRGIPCPAYNDTEAITCVVCTK